MEIIMLLFLLALMQSGGDVSASLQKALNFYRENENFIKMLANNAKQGERNEKVENVYEKSSAEYGRSEVICEYLSRHPMC